MLINKETILRAIDEESLLRANSFGNHLDPECEVCAVGAILRRAKAPSDAADYAVTPACFIAEDYDTQGFVLGTPLGQISAAFEYAVEQALYEGWTYGESLELGRLHALFIAEAFCPAQVEINIPVLKARTK